MNLPKIKIHMNQRTFKVAVPHVNHMDEWQRCWNFVGYSSHLDWFWKLVSPNNKICNRNINFLSVRLKFCQTNPLAWNFFTSLEMFSVTQYLESDPGWSLDLIITIHPHRSRFGESRVWNIDLEVLSSLHQWCPSLQTCRTWAWLKYRMYTCKYS